jgi:hypothetical protein
MTPLVGRLLAGSVYLLAMYVALYYGWRSRIPHQLLRMSGFAVVLGYISTLYYIMAYRTYIGLSVNVLLPYFQYGQITLGLTVALQIILTHLNARASGNMQDEESEE